MNGTKPLYVLRLLDNEAGSHRMYDEREEAYAVILDDKIDVRTVSPTRRAAIVNWLVVNCDCLISPFNTDEQIEQIWRDRSGDAFVGRVEISQALPAI